MQSDALKDAEYSYATEVSVLSQLQTVEVSQQVVTCTYIVYTLVNVLYLEPWLLVMLWGWAGYVMGSFVCVFCFHVSLVHD